ncbi:hypothetical protein WT58_24025 [Burkholderia territorii]|uniref:ATP-grasp domain-containing protein n=1 Tax=Burkholderia territorii TaxID=1503055 RepID=UPI00075B7CA4|nr:hypothetical protein [Burkholderia territorii]KWH03705.1 hypothetical protein WT58_24025 [Burkholderia territorii]
MKIYPYMNGSKSARALADALGIKILKREGVRRKVDVLINWGCSNIDRDIQFKKILNSPDAVKDASNKLRSFQNFNADGVPTVPWTTEKHIAEMWTAEGSDVVVRHKLSGHSGEGLQIIKADDGVIPDAPLYTKYVKKTQEYRIHVFDGEVIFRQRKARKKEVPDEQVNWQVRNLAGGFIFANQDLAVPASVEQAAIAAVKALGLDFGAADVGCNKEGEAVVYEVNTACGLEGRNLEAYANKFREFI